MKLKTFLKLLKIARLSLGCPRYFALLIKYKKFTMIPAICFIRNLQLTATLSEKAGSIVECGTWKGGMIAGIAECLGSRRSYYLFDSFEGLPPATELDGQSAADWQKNTSNDLYHDNCLASETDAQIAMGMAGITKPKIIKGWFKDTLPGLEIPEGIALLRLDGDWYESTIQILENLFPQVISGGLVIIDDYYFWDGCTRAVHDYLSANKRTERICSFDGVCYIIKR
jgi:O-methyltransferase